MPETQNFDAQISALLDTEDQTAIAERERRANEDRARRHASMRSKALRVHELDSQIARLSKKRGECASSVDFARQNHPVIDRFERSQQIANAAGVGHAWSVVREWLVSGRPRTMAPPQAIPMLVPRDQVPDSLRFDDADRAVIIEFVKLSDEARRTNIEHTQAVQERDSILSECPDLRDLQ